MREHPLLKPSLAALEAQRALLTVSTRVRGDTLQPLTPPPVGSVGTEKHPLQAPAPTSTITERRRHPGDGVDGLRLHDAMELHEHDRQLPQAGREHQLPQAQELRAWFTRLNRKYKAMLAEKDHYLPSDLRKVEDQVSRARAAVLRAEGRKVPRPLRERFSESAIFG